MLRKLNQYFLGELIKTFFISLVVAEVVLLGLQAIRLSSLVVNQGLEWGLIFRLLYGLSTSFLPAVFPISFLFSLLIVFGRMAHDRELLALQAMGYGPKKMLSPALWLGAAVTVLTLWISFDVGPHGNKNFEIAIDTIYKKKVTNVLRSGTISDSFLGRVIFVDEVDPFSQRLKRVFIYDETSFTQNTSISASTGQWINSESGIGTLKLYDGLIFTQNQNSEKIQRIRFNEYHLNVDFSVQLARGRSSPASQSWDQLLQKRADLEDSDRDARSVWMEIARRFSVSLACILFVPLSFLLAMNNRRGAKNQAVFSGLVIVIAYWAVYFLLSTSYQRSSWAPFREYEWLAWIVIGIPNIILLASDIFLYRLRSKVQV